MAEKASTLSRAPVAPSMSEAWRSWRVKAGASGVSSWSQEMSSTEAMAMARSRGRSLVKDALSCQVFRGRERMCTP